MGGKDRDGASVSYVEKYANKYEIMKKVLLCLMCLPMCCEYLKAQVQHTEYQVLFRVGRHVLEPAFGDNAARLSDIIACLRDVENSDTLYLSGIMFGGSASPEGSFGLNRSLAAARMAALEDYVRTRVTLADSVVSRRDGSDAWQRLAALVSRSDMEHKKEVLDIVIGVPEFTFDDRGILTDSRKKHLMDMRRGSTWRHLTDRYFGPLRNAVVVVSTSRRTVAVADMPPACDDTVSVVGITRPVADDTLNDDMTAGGAKKNLYMGIKTNMLYDALAVPNIGAELYLGRGWSVTGNWMYGWWKSDRRHRYWRIYGGDVALRRWFGTKAAAKPLTGHHIGLYGQLFTYDFEWGSKGYMGGRPGGTLWDELNYATGIEYGYSLPAGRRLNVDFTVGAGYWGGIYYEYIPLDGHYVWQETKRRRWIGPTKVEVSLVWLIGRGNRNTKKGGVQ